MMKTNQDDEHDIMETMLENGYGYQYQLGTNMWKQISGSRGETSYESVTPRVGLLESPNKDQTDYLEKSSLKD